MIRMMIADDHAVVRNGVRLILALAPDVELVAEAVDSHEVWEVLRGQPIDLLMLDMNMPGVCGIDLINRIMLSFPKLLILVFTMHNDSQLATRALKSGASGYICKDCDPETLLEAVRKVSSGGKFLAPEIAEKIALEATTVKSQLPHQTLSDRELEVFKLLVEGKSSNEIAENLCVSNKTISTHKLHLMEKLQISNIADLVRYALQHGLIN